MSATNRFIGGMAVYWLCSSFAAYGADSDAPAGAFNPPKQTEADQSQLDSAVQEKVTDTPEPAPPAYLKQMPQVIREVNTAINNCKDKYLLGEVKTHARLVHCINPAVLTIYQRAGYPYMDLIEQVNAKRLAIARQIDGKTLSQAQGEAFLSDFLKHIAEEEKKRNANPAAPNN